MAFLPEGRCFMPVLNELGEQIQQGIIWFDLQGKILGANSLAKKIMNTENTEFIEQHLPQQVKELVCSNQSGLTGQENPVTFTFSGKNIQGIIFGVENHRWLILKDEVPTILEETHLLLQTIIDSIQDAISVVNEQGIQILINRAYTELTGLTDEEVINKPATVDIAEGESVHYQVLNTHQPVKGIPMKVGPYRRDVIVSCAPLIKNNQLKGSVGVIHDVSEIKQLAKELDRTQRKVRHLESKYTFEDIIGESPSLKKTVERARIAARSPVTVLLRGECGTGKELFAHAIHRASDRANKPFIRVNCASISGSLLESELFGYVGGAFTGARKGGKKGYFEEANGGILLLDEIGAMEQELQVKLLRVLQEGEIVKIGASKSIPIDTRIIAATNANLENMVEQGWFRKDLYYRLNVFPLEIPPLREMPEDIPLLADYYLNRYGMEFGRPGVKISKQMLGKLKEYSWPGNIRELQNLLSRALINLNPEEKIIEEHHFALPFSNAESGNEVKAFISPGKSLGKLKSEWERGVIVEAIKQAKGNKTEAARNLEISVRNLYQKLDKYDIKE